MTEKTKKPDKPKGARYAVDPVAFAIALIGAPLLIAAIGFWALLIPVFAVVFGGPVYLIVGTPILLIYLHYREGDAGDIAILAFLTNAALLIILAVYGQVTNREADVEGALAMGAFGLAMAPLWGSAFGWIYNRKRSAASRRPLPPFIPMQKGDLPC